MQLLNGKVALITGAKGGLGTHVSRAFLAAGATVAGVSRSIASTDFEHPNFIAVPAELSSAAAAEDAVRQTMARCGRLDAVVHLMGGWTGGVPLEATDEAAFDRMLQLNLKPVFYVMRAAVPVLRAQGGGRLLAIASKAALEPQPNSAAYAASKAGVVSLMRTLAVELRDSGVTSNVVLPGTMDTPQNRAAMPSADPLRWVRPCHVAALLVHLASEAGAGISGATVPVYGADL